MERMERLMVVLQQATLLANQRLMNRERSTDGRLQKTAMRLERMLKK